MFHYLFKTYIANGREYYEFATADDEKVQRTKKDFPFPESLLTLLYLDVFEIDRITKRMDKALRSFYSSRDLNDLHEVERGLDELAPKHICFELLRLEWLERIRLASAMEPNELLNMLPHKKISHIYSNIAAMQDQIKELIAQVLDTDSEKKSVSEKMAAYYTAAGEDTLHTFQFQPQSMNFEVIDRKVFAEVLYPSDIYDLIDFHVRECIKREVKMHLCKNCLRYFVSTGNRRTEYCDRICDSKGRTCREIGAMNTWTERKQSDEVFKEYRREYKKRFARINAGKLTKGAFYIWSEEARQKKEQCDNGDISHEEFSRWLKESI
ncbi:MAG: hypothetical protein IJ955_09695 [Oscillospiraceae bacterium]|nr:hypothetical protein [Oscillospiraceae bacterium]